jgi:hypothetical protein
MDLVDVAAIRILDGFEAEFTFSDGLVRRIDLDPYIRGPIFQPLRDDPVLFRSAFVDPEGGAISWPNGADIDTQVLRYGLRPASWDPVD